MKKTLRSAQIHHPAPIVNAPDFRVEDLLKEKGDFFKLKLLAGVGGLKRVIRAFELNRPGLALLGHLDYFRAERVQIIGRGESGFIAKARDHELRENLGKMLSHRDLPCLLHTWNLKAPRLLREVCEHYQVPLLASDLDTARLIGELIPYLEERLAPTQSIHGVLVNVYGLGVLIVGASGIGKSECALELLKRNHILISDDLIQAKRLAGEIVIGSPAKIEFGHYMELRGLGIVDMRSLFGVGSVIDKTRVELVVELKPTTLFKRGQHWERLGLEEKTYPVLGVKLPYVIFPVVPGRNLAILIEVAALNQRLKNQGIFPAREFEASLVQKTAKNKI